MKTAEKKKYAEGQVEGRVEGLAEGRTEVVRDRLWKGLPVEDISEITGLTIEAVERLKKQI